MIFIETPIFTRLIKELMSDEDYRELQEALVFRPEMGDVIRGADGLRKVRWALEGRGKSGGVRVIYYWVTADDQILIDMRLSQEQTGKFNSGAVGRITQNY